MRKFLHYLCVLTLGQTLVYGEDDLAFSIAPAWESKYVLEGRDVINDGGIFSLTITFIGVPILIMATGS